MYTAFEKNRGHKWSKLPTQGLQADILVYLATDYHMMQNVHLSSAAIQEDGHKEDPIRRSGVP